MNRATTPDRPGTDLPCAFAALAVALLALALPANPAFTAILVLAGAVVAWFAPAVMVAAVLVTIPLQDKIVLPFVAGSLTLTQIALFGLVIGWAAGIWRREVWLDAVFWWSVAILGALCFSATQMDEFGLWAGEVYRWGAAVVFYLIARSVLRDWSAIRLVLWGTIIAVCASSAFGFGQLIDANGPKHMMRGGVLRVFAAFGTPNPFAAYMELTVPILLAVALVGLRRDCRERLGLPLWIAAAIATAMGSAIVALTQSRGGWVGFAAAMVVLVWVLPLRLRLIAVLAAVILGTLVLITPPGQSQLHRFEGAWADARRDASLPETLIDVARTGRESVWGAAIGMFQDEPFTGMGAGEYDYHYRQYTTDWHYHTPLGQAHNGWLHMAAQAGIVGALTFTGWILAMLLSLHGATRRSSSPLGRALALGALATVVAFAVHSVVDYLNVLSLGLQLAAVVAIGLNLAPRRATAAEPRTNPSIATPTVQAGHA